jgi:hypothetical protein
MVASRLAPARHFRARNITAVHLLPNSCSDWPGRTHRRQSALLAISVPAWNEAERDWGQDPQLSQNFTKADVSVIASTSLGADALLGSLLDSLRAPSPIGWERVGVRGAGVVHLVDSSVPVPKLRPVPGPAAIGGRLNSRLSRRGCWRSQSDPWSCEGRVFS